MNISDEMLSGFLDTELASEEMEQVRLALETDDELVMRMAELSQVDQWVVEHAQQIDQTAVPQKLVSLAQQIDAIHSNKVDKQNNVVVMSAWKKRLNEIKTPYAMAAGVAIVASFLMFTVSEQSVYPGLPSEVAAILDISLSGDTRYLANGNGVNTQLSFANQQGQLCRQYQVLGSQGSTNIACKHNNGWQLEAQSGEQGLHTTSDYQTASSNQQLDSVIDKMISGAPLDREQEQQAINHQWQLEKQNRGEL